MAWNLQATAWQLLDDPRWRTVSNFDEMVRSYRIKVPPSCPDLPAYFADLQETLIDLHAPPPLASRRQPNHAAS